MKKIIFFSLVAAAGLAGFASSYAQDTTQQRQIQAASGRVADMDWVAGKLVVDTGGDEVTFIVPDDIKITKGAEEVSFSDLNINDYVTIEYYDAGFVGLKAARIGVKTTGY